MNRRQRLMATLRGESVDRPAVSFYEIGGFKIDPTDPDEFNVYNSEQWQPLLKLAMEDTDIIRMVSAVRAQSHQSWGSNQDGKSVREQFITTDRWEDNDGRHTKITVEVAGRVMNSTMLRRREMDTVWTTEHLLKDNDDVRAYLELPDEVFAEMVDTQSLEREEELLGDSGIVMVDTEDPICAVATLFNMENFTIFAMTEQDLCHKLLAKCARYIQARTEKVAADFPGRLWRIYGPEFACRPYLPPNLFDEYVVRYTKPMVTAIKEHGGFARLHAHGMIKEVLDMIVDMGADAIDPIEPAPQGDVTLEYVRQKYGKDVVLFGNLEISDIEMCEPNKYKATVQRSLEEGTAGAGRGFVLMPSASPYGRDISQTTLQNYRTMVELTRNFKPQEMI